MRGLLVKRYDALAIDGCQAVRQWREGDARDVFCGVLRDAFIRLAVEYADVVTGGSNVAAAGVEGHKVHGRRA